MAKAAYRRKQLSELTVLDGGAETKGSHLDPQAGNREQSWNDISFGHQVPRKATPPNPNLKGCVNGGQVFKHLDPKADILI